MTEFPISHALLPCKVKTWYLNVVILIVAHPYAFLLVYYPQMIGTHFMMNDRMEYEREAVYPRPMFMPWLCSITTNYYFSQA